MQALPVLRDGRIHLHARNMQPGGQLFQDIQPFPEQRRQDQLAVPFLRLPPRAEDAVHIKRVRFVRHILPRFPGQKFAEFPLIQPGQLQHLHRAGPGRQDPDARRGGKFLQPRAEPFRRFHRVVQEIQLLKGLGQCLAMLPSFPLKADFRRRPGQRDRLRIDQAPHNVPYRHRPPPPSSRE